MHATYSLLFTSEAQQGRFVSTVTNTCSHKVGFAMWSPSKQTIKFNFEVDATTTDVAVDVVDTMEGILGTLQALELWNTYLTRVCDGGNCLEAGCSVSFTNSRFGVA